MGWKMKFNRGDGTPKTEVERPPEPKPVESVPEPKTEGPSRDTWLYHAVHGAKLFLNATPELLRVLGTEGWQDTPIKKD